MPDISFIGSISFFLITTSLFILVKLYYIDPLHSKQIFDSCIKKDLFVDFDVDKITTDIYPLKTNKEKDTLETIKRALFKEDKGRNIYILEIEKKTFSPRNNFVIDYYTVVITFVNTVIKKEIKIIPKLNNFIGSKIEQDDIELSRLDPDFKFYFNIFSEKDYIVFIPSLLQLDLLQFRSTFPLSERKGEITTMIKLRPAGFSIISNRLSSFSEMDDLLALRDIVEVNVV